MKPGEVHLAHIQPQRILAASGLGASSPVPFTLCLGVEPRNRIFESETLIVF